MCKKRILVDLDGVLNLYRGCYNDEIPSPMPNADFFLKELNKDFFVTIFSSRDPKLVKKWLIDNNLYIYVDDITNIKKPSFIIIDDRSLTFDGNYFDMLSKIKNFKVWYE